MAPIRLPFPQVNVFRDWVANELEFRRGLWPTPISTPFVRLTSCNEDTVKSYKYFSLGLHGFDRSDINIFDQTYGSTKEIVGYAIRDGKKTLIGADEISYIPPQLQNVPPSPTMNQSITNISDQQSVAEIIAGGSHPIPGIKSISIKRTGLSAPMTAEIQWNCYNIQQLEFLRNHFMIVGNYIVLEWGQQYSNRQLTNILDFTADDIDQTLVDTLVQGRRYVIDNFSQPNDGNYDFLVGSIGNFNVELDSQNPNVFKCSTHLVSLGENIWGLNLSSTFINQKGDDNSAAVLNDLHSYFSGGGFDQLLGQMITDNTKYINPQSPPYNMDVLNAAGLGDATADPLDRTFISWPALTDDVINDMNQFFNTIPDSGNNVSLQAFRRQLKALLGLGSPPLDTLPDDIKANRQEAYDSDWIGNNPFLRSVDPDVMIVVTPALAKLGPTKDWVGNGTFGDDATPDRGKLANGVWLNARMVREAFLDSNNLQQAFDKILSQMSDAVGNYWTLKLYYDEELALYNVIDYQFSNNDDADYYEFNAELDFQHNETFEITLNTAFPPELITQMSAIAMIQSETPQERAADFQNLPLLNKATPFMYAVNWTSLHDILKQKIDSKYKSFDVKQGNSSKQIPVGTDDGSTSSLPVLGRVGDTAQKIPFTGNTPDSAGKAGAPRTTDQSIPSSNASILAPDEPTAPTPRSSALPVASKPVFALDSLPVTPLIITSRFGSRVPPVPGASGGTGHPHRGIDLGVSFVPVYAVKSGVVSFAMIQPMAGGGNSIHINHGNGYETRYLHLDSLDVFVGEKVSAGQQIAVSGDSGTLVTGPHLHFEILHNGTYIDPEPSLKSFGMPSSFASDPTNVMTAQDSLDSQGLESSTPSPEQQPTAQPSDTQSAKSTNADINNTNSTTASTDDPDSYLKVFAAKFGDSMIALIWPNKSILTQKIVQDGYSKLNSSLINGFISPYPTLTNVEIRIQGLAGISISDGFLVGKIPFVFSNYGIFQVTEITDAVTDSGWYTVIKGFYKLMWPRGRDT